MKKTIRKVISFLLVAVMIFVQSSIIATASNFDNAKNYLVSNHLIEVDGMVYSVSITLNEDGTQNITVVAPDEETISWTTINEEESEEISSRSSSSASYGSYRYIYNSSAYTVWNLYRPLQENGGAWAKGVTNDSTYCQYFAQEVGYMKDADARVSDYLNLNGLVSSALASIIWDGAGGAAGFYVGKAITNSLKNSIIAGIVTGLVIRYVIPYVWEAAITSLVGMEYDNIRSSMSNADYYFDMS